MNKITVKTHLKNREEVFRVLALGQATGYPILLKGIPGVGKTKSVLDYAGGVFNYNEKEILENSFILETDESTKGTAVKGLPNVKRLLEDNVYENYAPIADAKFILINEIDKASGNLRNSLLGVANEHTLFNGKEITPCQWEVFAASCNQIPKEEEDSPFWDRFVIKLDLTRLKKSDILYYCNDTTKEYKYTIDIPTNEEINKVVIPKEKLRKVIDLCYTKLSDRTLSYIPRLVGAASYVYGVSLNKALTKVVGLLAGLETAKQLSTQLEPEEMSRIRNYIDMINGITENDMFRVKLSEIDEEIRAATKKGALSTENVEELIQELQTTLDNNDHYNDTTDTDFDEDPDMDNKNVASVVDSVAQSNTVSTDDVKLPF